METTRPSIDIFRHANDTALFAAGTTIFREGDSADVMYVVKAGEVELRVDGEVVETVGAGGILGEMAVLGDHQPRSATATTVGESELVPISQERFAFLVQQTPFFAIEVMQVLAHRLRAMNARITAPAEA